MKLSDLKCRKAAASERLIKLADGEGLFLHVYPNGKKLWRLAYRYGGKQRDLAFGPYPHISLLQARKQREAAKDLLREGKDPAAERKADEETAAALQETTFAAFSDLYLDRLAKTGRSAPTIKKARWIVEDLAKELRDEQVADIKPRDVLRALRVVEAKGNRETARRMRGVLSAVFRLAVIEQAIDMDPSAPLKGALLPPETRHNSAVIDPDGFGALLRVIDGYDGHKTIKLALQLLALTFPRPGELRQAEWPEVDIAGALWIIPAPRTKMRREHRIPLSRQAVEKFEALKEITGRGQRCFPSIRSLDNPLSDGALNAALRAMGVDGSVHVAHGFRSSASSLLNEHSAFSPEVIERALAHGEPDKVRRAYNRAQYWDERVRMMQWWADYLDKLKRPRVSGAIAPAAEPNQVADASASSV
ncbi:MAG: integrase arm-type DNA-binding domain-containing protein [Planctomycetia bacterium]|nr:integrase arm-type DNA-binding domain-containing protein [Planctomycetia bacterium]